MASAGPPVAAIRRCRPVSGPRRWPRSGSLPGSHATVAARRRWHQGPAHRPGIQPEDRYQMIGCVLALGLGVPGSGFGRGGREPDLENVGVTYGEMLAGIPAEDHFDGPDGQAGGDEPRRRDIPPGQRPVADGRAEKPEGEPAQPGLERNALRRPPGNIVHKEIDRGRRRHDPLARSSATSSARVSARPPVLPSAPPLRRHRSAHSSRLVAAADRPALGPASRLQPLVWPILVGAGGVLLLLVFLAGAKIRVSGRRV